MLVLTRRPNQVIIIEYFGSPIEVRVLEVRGDQVRLGIKAPKDVSVHRKEIYDEIKTGTPKRKKGRKP